MIPLYKQYKQKTNEIESKINKNQVEYVLSNDVGWRRIARIGNAISRFYINYGGYGFCIASFVIGTTKGWDKILQKEFFTYTNGVKRFSKIRLVYKGNAESYIDIYNNHNVSNGGRVTITVDNTKEITLLQEETIREEAIPEGYTKAEITL